MKRRTLPFAAPGLIISVLLVPGSARAYVEKLDIDPPDPTVQDEVAVQVSGWLPTPCWTILGESRVDRPGEIDIQIEMQASPLMCIQIIVPYGRRIELGKLAAGSYRLNVADAQNAASIDFEVRGEEGQVSPAVHLGPSADANGDGSTDIADAIFILAFVFLGGPAPSCPEQANANGDAGIDLADAIAILTYLFAAGPSPAGREECAAAADCNGKPWLVDCLGHWSCNCGNCQAECDFVSCGDGNCDVQGGETPGSCPADCQIAKSSPICDKIGTRSEGWYDPESGKLLHYTFCADCEAQCRCGGQGEGWYDSCTGKLISYASNCDCAQE